MQSLSPQTRLAVYRVLKKRELKQLTYSKYHDDPVAWIEERARGFMYSKLREIARSVVHNRRTAVPSAHAIGKSWLSARLAAWWIDSRPPGSAFVVTTAPTSKQVRSILWKELHKVYSVANLDGRMNQTEWWINNEMVAMGRKPSNYDPTAFQGIHARDVLLVLDEACGVPQVIYIAGNSLIANEFGRMLAIGNPDDPDTYFHTICSPGSGWNVVPVSAYDTPNFTGEEAPQEVKDVLVNKVYVDEMRNDVGEDSGVFVSKILGQFPENKLDGVIPLSFIRKCQVEENYTFEDLLPVELGVDVGAGGDETSIRVRRGMFVGEFVEEKTPEPEQAFYLVAKTIMSTGATRVKIDIIGIGWGLIGLLRQAQARGKYTDETTGESIFISPEVEIIGVNVGRSATNPEKYPRLRDQMWYQIGRDLSASKGWNLYGLDEKTIGQLTDPIRKPDIANRDRVESKQETMKRTGRPSPNRADALLLAYCNPPSEDQEEMVIYHDPVEIGPEY